jgi:hypothetical protein
MPRSQRRRPALTHPEPAEFDVLDILHALSDPTRMTIVQTLRAAPERACGTFPWTSPLPRSPTTSGYYARPESSANARMATAGGPRSAAKTSKRGSPASWTRS